MGNRETTRLKDLAQMAGVSIKTVSRVVNNHPDVSEETRETVLRLVRETAYTPNLGARGLRLNKTYTVGFIFPQITNEFFLEVALSLDRAARQNGYSVIMSSTNETHESELESLQVLVSKRVDGIVLVSVGTTGGYLRTIMEQNKIPVVLIGNRMQGISIPAVLQDNGGGAKLLTDHLIQHGHRHIAYVTGPLNNSSSQERFEGYSRALKEGGIQTPESLVKVSDWTYSGGYEATLELTRREKGRPTAIFYANANTAIGAFRAFRRQHLRVPEDIALVSFEHISITDALDPPLTTLNKVDRRLGEMAFKLLYGSMSPEARQGFRATETRVNAKLCIRESCGCNRGATRKAIPAPH